jgi:hypothetical protein
MEDERKCKINAKQTTFIQESDGSCKLFHLLCVFF